MTTCSLTGCGRPESSRGLCQTHYKQTLKLGKTKAIRPYRPRRAGTKKYAGLTLTAEAVEALEGLRKRLGLGPHGAVAHVVEGWHSGRRP